MQKEIRKPRNHFMHQTLTAKLRIKGDHRAFAPRDPDKYRDWESVHQVNARSTLATDFCEVGVLAQDTIKMVATTINDLWNAMWRDNGAQFMQKLPKHNKHAKNRHHKESSSGAL